MQKNAYQSGLAFLRTIARPYRKWYWAAALCSALGVPATLFQTFLTARLIDQCVDGTSLISAFPLALVTLLMAALTFAGARASALLSAKASIAMKERIADTLLEGDFRTVASLRAGDALRTIDTDCAAVTDFLSNSMIPLLSQALTAAGALVCLFAIEPRLALVTVGYIPIGMASTMWINGKLGKLYPKSAELSGEALSVTEQALRCLPVAKAFAMEKRFMALLNKPLAEQKQVAGQIGFWQGLLQPACYCLSHLPQMLFMLTAGRMVFDGAMSVGLYLAVTELINCFIGPAVYFPFLLDGFNKAFASMTRVQALTNIPRTPSAIRSDPGAKTPSVQMDGVTFTYGREQVLHAFTLTRQGPGLTALTGPSGGGKSTVIRLLYGLVHPDVGDIAVNGTVGCVPQDTWLLRGTLRENIACCRPDADDATVMAAARRAGVDEFAQALPQGYETILGDGGADLSGGQKKRLAFARLLLRETDIWLLDEPDASLDPQSAETIERAIREESRRRRIIMTAHNPRMLALTDDIITICGNEREKTCS